MCAHIQLAARDRNRKKCHTGDAWILLKYWTTLIALSPSLLLFSFFVNFAFGDIFKGSYPTAETQPLKGPSGRNSSYKVPSFAVGTITATPKIAAATTTSTFVNFTLDPDFRVTVQENLAFMSLNTCGRTSRGGRWVWQHHRGNTETLFAVQLFCCPQSVYVTHDADGSGVISSQELPAAFRKAGMRICVC